MAQTCTSPAAPPSGLEDGQFAVGPDGTIWGPGQKPFVAHGIDVLEGNQPSASALRSAFPNANFVRLAIYDYASPESLAAYVKELTDAGFAVELEDHNNNAGNAGGSQGTIFAGQALTTELNWYSQVASYFKGNPYVWFGTNNEPSEIDASGNFNPAALTTWQQQTYNAIRSTGNNAPVMLEMNGYSPASTGQGYTSSVYAGMTNVVWDMHYYGWLSQYSTDQSTVTETLAGMVQQAQTIRSAGGFKIPVIVGEYGNSTTGQGVDPNGDEVIKAVAQATANGQIAGGVAWAWLSGSGDALVNGDGSLSSYGQQIVGAMQTMAGACSSTLPPASTTSLSTDLSAITTSDEVVPQIDTTPHPAPPANLQTAGGQAPNTGGSLQAPPSDLSDIPPTTGYVSWYSSDGLTLPDNVSTGGAQ